MLSVYSIISNNRDQVAKAIIEHGNLEELSAFAKNNPGHLNKMLPLAYALGKKEAFSEILRLGANPNKTRLDTEFGAVSLLHVAAENKDGFWLETMLEHGGDPNLKDNLLGNVPLAYAISERVAGNLDMLLKYGADANGQADYGFSMAAFAFSQGEYDMVASLIEHGADVNPTGIPVKSLIFQMQSELSARLWDFTTGNAKKHGTFDSLQKILDWFDEQRLDWRNATYDKSKESMPQKWNIPRLPDHDE
jgi:hypothetical protein